MFNKMEMGGGNRNISTSEIDITSYTSSSNLFVAPSDGYIVGTINTGSGQAAIRMQNGVALLSIPVSASNYQGYGIFIPKGMKVYVDNASKFIACSFYGLTEY